MDSIEVQKLKIHLIYLVSILSFLLVITASSIWTPQENFTTFLSNSATATSLVLGVIAIVYSFISNSDLSKGLGNITQASSEIGRAKDQISTFIGQVQQMNQTGIDNSERLSKVSLHITDTVGQLNGALEAIAEKTSELQGAVHAIPKRMDDLEATLIGQGAKREADSNGGSVINWTQPEIQNFYKRSSLNVNLLTYAIALAFERKAELSTEVFSDKLEIKMASYFYGVASVMDGVDLFRRKLIKGKGRTFSITKVTPVLTSESIREYIVIYLKDRSELDDDEINVWVSKLEVIEGMYPKAS